MARRAWSKKHQRGLTLAEVAVGTLLLVGGIGPLLLGMHYTMIRIEYLNQFQVAMSAVEGELEVLMNTSFDTLWADPSFASARGSGLKVPIAQLAVAGGNLSVQIRSADLKTPGTPTVLDLYVSACWQTRGRRIGEDLNCNGSLDAGEDTNGNGWLDSPAMASTRVARSG